MQLTTSVTKVLIAGYLRIFRKERPSWLGFNYYRALEGEGWIKPLKILNFCSISKFMFKSVNSYRVKISTCISKWNIGQFIIFQNSFKLCFQFMLSLKETGINKFKPLHECLH